jgi:hypothetical protein
VRALVEPLGSAVLSVLQEHARLANFSPNSRRACARVRQKTTRRFDDDEPQKIISEGTAIMTRCAPFGLFVPE